MGIIKKKISDFDASTTLSNLWTLGYSIANGIKKTVRISLDFLKEAADNANNAANAANAARENITEDLAAKADLDNEKRYVTPQQINPRQGKQQGVLTEYGYYYNGGNDFVLSGSQTHVVTFVTGEDVTSPQTVAAGKHFSFTLVVGGMNNAAIAPNTLYQAVYVIDAATSKGSMYLNGVLVSTGDVAAASEAFYIGKYRRDTPRIFKGTVISYRQFNSAMTSKDIADMWNNARPAEWRVPPALSDNCTVDFEPESLLPGSWRNLIKGGADISYTSYGSQANSIYDYTVAPPADDITIDSGIVYTDISGSQRIIMSIPVGYIPYGIGVQNFNDTPLTNVILNWDEGGVLADLGTVPVTPVSTHRTGIRMAAPDQSNLLITIVRPYARVTVKATGNTSTGGIRVAIKCKWIGFYEKES